MKLGVKKKIGGTIDGLESALNLLSTLLRSSERTREYFKRTDEVLIMVVIEKIETIFKELDEVLSEL